MNYDPFDLTPYLDALRSAWVEHCRLELNDARAALANAMIGARLLSVPEPAAGMPAVSHPIVMHMDAAALPAARAALERAGWICEDETATEVRLVRNSTGLVLTSVELSERAEQSEGTLRPLTLSARAFGTRASRSTGRSDFETFQLTAMEASTTYDTVRGPEVNAGSDQSPQYSSCARRRRLSSTKM